MSLTIRSLNTADASACSSLILEHFAHDPGYCYLWGKNPDHSQQHKRYTEKISLLIGDEKVRTVGVYDDNDPEKTIIGFAAWNPASYTKSWSLAIQQNVLQWRWGLSLWSLISDLLWTSNHVDKTKTPAAENNSKTASTSISSNAQQNDSSPERGQRIMSFRRAFVDRVTKGPEAEIPLTPENHIWLMHLATKDNYTQDSARKTLLDAVFSEANSDSTRPLHVLMQTQSLWENVETYKQSGFQIVGNDTFTDGEEKVEMWVMIRP